MQPEKQPRRLRKLYQAADFAGTSVINRSRRLRRDVKLVPVIRRFQVKTNSRDDWVDLTGEVERAAEESGLAEGVVTVFIPHTTAGVTIQENADPPLKGDITRALDKLFPWKGGWAHCEDNAASHMKAAVVGSSVQVIFAESKLILGTWQNVFLCEFDGPRTRDVIIKVSP